MCTENRVCFENLLRRWPEGFAWAHLPHVANFYFKLLFNKNKKKINCTWSIFKLNQ